MTIASRTYYKLLENFEPVSSTLPFEQDSPKSLKSAYDQGWVELRSVHYGGSSINLKGHTLGWLPKVALSRPEWKRRGYEVKPDEKQTPHTYVIGLTNVWPVFREDQVRKTISRQNQSPKSIDLLAAVWGINRRAKRCRDLSQLYFQASMYGFATAMRREKENLYQLKGQALHYMTKQGVVEAAGFHCFGDNWAMVLKGEGYVFHTPCPRPKDGCEGKRVEQVEAKPRQANEPKLKDARYTVETYLAEKPIVKIYCWPSRRALVEVDDDYPILEADEEGFWEEDDLDDEEGGGHILL